MTSAGIKTLVDKLESHIYADEREFEKVLKITPSIEDVDLDSMFLSDQYDKSEILSLLSITNHDESDLQDTHLK